MNPNVRATGIWLEGVVVRAVVHAWDRLGAPRAQRRRVSPRFLLMLEVTRTGGDTGLAAGVADHLLRGSTKPTSKHVKRLQREASRHARNVIAR